MGEYGDDAEGGDPVERMRSHPSLTGPEGAWRRRAPKAAVSRGRTGRRPRLRRPPNSWRLPAHLSLQYRAGADEPVALATEAVDKPAQRPGSQEWVVVHACDVVADDLLRPRPGQDLADRARSFPRYMRAYDVSESFRQHRSAVDVANQVGRSLFGEGRQVLVARWPGGVADPLEPGGEHRRCHAVVGRSRPVLGKLPKLGPWQPGRANRCQRQLDSVSSPRGRVLRHRPVVDKVSRRVVVDAIELKVFAALAIVRVALVA